MAIRPDAIGIVVRDMAKALAFYRLLGLSIPEGEENEGHVEVTANGYRIMFDTEEMIKSFNPDWVRPVGQSMALAFRCDTPDEVDGVYNTIIDQGYRGLKEPWDAFWGQRYAIVLDPDGHTIDLFAKGKLA